jgi:hypothetical protein
MPNTLSSAVASPASIASGASTNITVSCTVSSPGPMTISATTGYTITTKTRQLVKDQAPDVFSETITGPKGLCMLTFVFAGSSTTTGVTIT